ncbi:hypothetical protein E4U55_004326 [Claviceps digitariae]|nr:hypothetical protein E4U55_004326 [Claviceps digitariae]
MEEYIKPVAQFQHFPLSAFDMQGSFSNIPYAFIYENKRRCEEANDEQFMPTNHLKESLGLTLESFPILLGHVRATARCKLRIDVDPSCINVPDFQETILSNNDITFADLKAANFAWKAWPEGVATVKAVATPHQSTGDIKLLNVHVMRLGGDSGVILFVNCPHYVFDGAGFFAFVKEWAFKMRSSASTDPSVEYCHRRDCIQKYLVKQIRPVDPVSNAIYATSNFFCDALTWLSPVNIGRLLGKLGNLSPSGQGHLFHISQKKLEELRELSKAYVPNDCRLSANDLLVALVSRTFNQSQQQPDPRPGLFGAAPPPPETHFTVRIPCDARSRLGVKENYTGNLLIPILVREEMSYLRTETDTKTLATSALEVRKCVRDIDAALVSGYHSVLSEHPTSYMRPLAFAASHTTSSMVATSQVRFGLYDADFGAGRPSFVCPTPLFEGSYTIAAFLPPPPEKDGVYILLTTNRSAMAHVLNNKVWCQVSELLW